MITDNFLRLSGSLTAGSTTGQDLAQIAGTYNSDNIVDLSQTRDIGEGEKLFVVFTVGTAFTSGGAATLSFNVVTSAAAGLTTPTTLGSTNLIALGSLTAGAQFVIAINPLVASLGLRYLGVIYTIGTATTTAGTMTADIVTDIQDGKKFYASGFTVL
jgi:hypothetical protein